MNHPQGRARTPKEKRAVVEALYAAWCAVPELRLGQLIVCAVDEPFRPRVFHREDESLVEDVKRFVTNQKGMMDAHTKDR